MKKIPKIINKQIKNNYEFSSNKEDKIKAAQFGYQLATDGREQKKHITVDGVEEIYDSFANWYHDDGEYDNFRRSETMQSIEEYIQSSLKEKEKECEQWKLIADQFEKSSNLNYEKCHSQIADLEELKAENERLHKIVDIVNDRPDL